jgi:hypothetical protein
VGCWQLGSGVGLERPIDDGVIVMRSENLEQKIEELARGNLIVHKAMACYRMGAFTYEHALQEMVLALAKSEKRARQMALDARIRSRLPVFADESGVEGFDDTVNVPGFQRGHAETRNRRASNPLRLVSSRAPDGPATPDSTKRH